ncbi:HNH endonuclease signature motif containing protein [Hoyosella subflava]|uniref:HNH endonuclease n=1 Tax=Hoyosella subflava (strain DSM 45089 / JCM 17490 / NBRC 109087 / DQS3-9A1) TaxID=443218 RepID=F6EH40_HOYSD|nr:HNH endonuclease signature motif containing protein [Hoyosella subflava]AEF39877.1 HNH endonuclease [Hoyosella subflava DQS3-9A1]
MFDNRVVLGGDIGEDLFRVADAELVARLRDLEVAQRRLQAAQALITAEIVARGVMGTFGYADAAGLLRDVLNVDAKDARQRARRAEMICATAGIDGSVVPATLPAAGAALREGEISASHVDVIDQVLSLFPPATERVFREEGERILTELARTNSPVVVRRAGREILDRLDPDGKEPDTEKLTQPRRELHLAWSVKGDRLRLSGYLDKESGVRLETLLSPLAKPRPAEDATPDLRSVSERCGDGLAELLEYTERAEQLPSQGGEPPRCTITMTIDQLLGHDDRPVKLNDHRAISAAEARRLACDAKIVPAVLGGESEVLDLGRAVRTASLAQRCALYLRDKGCVFPGCDRPPGWTQAHHIKEWCAQSGPTDLANLCLLCSYHHRLIHHSDWTIRVGTDGQPDIIPPVWLDPEQRPRRNTYHQACRAPARLRMRDTRKRPKHGARHGAQPSAP